MKTAQPATLVPNSEVESRRFDSSEVEQVSEPAGSPDFPVRDHQPRADTGSTDRRRGDGHTFEALAHLQNALKRVDRVFEKLYYSFSNQ